MSEADVESNASGQSADRPDKSFGVLAFLGKQLRQSDILLAAAVVGVLVVLILPMPSWLLDFSLAVSITFSVMILMTCLFIQMPLEFSSFPTVLLLATMLRLSQLPKAPWSTRPALSVRLYHDARSAEVVEYQRDGYFRAVYDYPNRHMRLPDEKAQVNRFLGEFLSMCLVHGVSVREPVLAG